MNTKDFEYLAAIGKYRNISKAAQELYISQPALSKFLQKMESEFGTPLFQHIGKTLVPTYAGEYCLEKAAEILFLNEQINNRCNDISRLSVGRIKIGLPMSRTNYFISQILPAFYQKFPGIHIVIAEDSTSTLIHKLRMGDLDLIFVNYTENDALPYLIYDPVSLEEMVLAAPINYGLKSQARLQPSSPFPFLPLDSWKNLPFIMLNRDQATRRFVNEYFSSHHITPNIVLQIRNLGQALNAVGQGLGVTITPSLPGYIETPDTTISYFSLDSLSKTFQRKTAVVYREDRYLSEAEKGLIYILKNPSACRTPAP